MTPSMLLCVVLAFLLIGCSNYNANQQHELNESIIRETRHCLDAGLEPRALQTVDGIVLSVQCRPKEPTK